MKREAPAVPATQRSKAGAVAVGELHYPISLDYAIVTPRPAEGASACDQAPAIAGRSMSCVAFPVEAVGPRGDIAPCPAVLEQLRAGRFCARGGQTALRRCLRQDSQSGERTAGRAAAVNS